MQMVKLLHYPRLDTILMVENAIKNAKEYKSKRQLWISLPKKIMYQTLNVILDYLERSDKIVITEGKVIWIWNESDENHAKSELLAIMNTLLKNSKLTQEDAIILGRKINAALAKRYFKDKENAMQEHNKSNEIEEIEKVIVPILKKHDVKKAAIFGSTARGEARKDSDVDILVEFKSTPSLFDVGGLYNDIEEGLKKSVDIVTYKSIDPRLRKRILNEKVDIL